MSKSVCVFCSSSDAVTSAFFEAATELGTLIAQRSWSLVYGGASTGLMGALARSVHANGGKVIGVVPEALRGRGMTYQAADELITTQDLHERKAVMAARSDAFVTLPGGFGTLEETLEILTLKQLQLHAKPIVLVNTEGFYDRLIAVFEHFYHERFTKQEYRQLYHIAPDASGAVSYIEGYRPMQFPTKWFESGR